MTVTTTTVNSLQVGQPVLISGVSPASFNGIFAVTAVNNTSFQYFAHAPCPSGAPSGSGGTASYANPVASVGVDLNVRSVSINDETEKALLVDPTSAEPAFIFNILDQSSAPVNNLPASTSNIAGAINPLTNGALVLNKGGQGLCDRSHRAHRDLQSSSRVSATFELPALRRSTLPSIP